MSSKDKDKHQGTGDYGEKGGSGKPDRLDEGAGSRRDKSIGRLDGNHTTKAPDPKPK
jgi:hypothetical protein